MANILIKDLSDSTELDLQAMRTIVGGARSGGRPWQAIAAIFEDRRIVAYPPGIKGASAKPARKK
jgi:hypothetical protein